MLFVKSAQFKICILFSLRIRNSHVQPHDNRYVNNHAKLKYLIEIVCWYSVLQQNVRTSLNATIRLAHSVQVKQMNSPCMKEASNGRNEIRK